jgi:hypothetical protein
MSNDAIVRNQNSPRFDRDSEHVKVRRADHSAFVSVAKVNGWFPPA